MLLTLKESIHIDVNYFFSFIILQKHLKASAVIKVQLCLTCYMYCLNNLQFKFESQNHRLDVVGMDVWRLSGPIPLLKQGNLHPDFQAKSRCPLDIPKEGDSITSPGNLCQGLLTLTGERCLLMFRAMSCISVCAHRTLLYYWAPLKRAWLHLLCTLPSGTQ